MNSFWYQLDIIYLFKRLIYKIYLILSCYLEKTNYTKVNTQIPEIYESTVFDKINVSLLILFKKNRKNLRLSLKSLKIK